MGKIDRTWEKDGFLLRPALREDAESYFSQNFCPWNREVVRFTGSKETFTHEGGTL